jgi:hypothetical protein
MAQYYEGIGRRKESTARVRLTTGSGKIHRERKRRRRILHPHGRRRRHHAPIQRSGSGSKQVRRERHRQRRRHHRPDRISTPWNCPRAPDHQRRVDIRSPQEGLAHPRRPREGT